MVLADAAADAGLLWEPGTSIEEDESDAVSSSDLLDNAERVWYDAGRAGRHPRSSVFVPIRPQKWSQCRVILRLFLAAATPPAAVETCQTGEWQRTAKASMPGRVAINNTIMMSTPIVTISRLVTPMLMNRSDQRVSTEVGACVKC